MGEEVETLMQLSVHAAADNATRIGQGHMEGLPVALLTMISQSLSAQCLNSWNQMLIDRGVQLQRTWQNHLIARWPCKYKLEDLYLEKPWTKEEPQQLYLQSHFHTLFRRATVDPADNSFDSFSTPLHRLPNDLLVNPMHSHLHEHLLALAPHVKQLTISGTYDEVNYLMEHKDIFDALLQGTKSLVVHHLNIQRYSHVRANIFEEFIIKGNVESLSLKHCVLEEVEWRDLMTVCTGTAQPGSYKTPLVTGTKRKCEMDAALSSATKRIRCEGETQDTAPNDEPSPSTSSNTEEAQPRNRPLKAFSIYVTHSFDFSSILGEALKSWSSIEKIEIWQPDAYSFKMILPNEINRKVRSGQIKHGVISGCLAVAGQLPLFLEALLIRHGNGGEPMSHVELEGSYIWAGSQPIRDFRDTDNFRACENLVLRESIIADDTCHLLCSMFETDQALRCVRLHDVKLGMVWCHVGRVLPALASRGQLEILELVKVNCMDSLHLLPSIILKLPNLRHLILNDCSLNFTPELFQEFSDAIVGHQSIEVLSLSENSLGRRATDLLANLFMKPKPYPRLKLLDLRMNRIRADDLCNAVYRISQHFDDRVGDGHSLWKLSLLNLGGNDLYRCVRNLQCELRRITDILRIWDSGQHAAEHLSQM